LAPLGALKPESPGRKPLELLLFALDGCCAGLAALGTILGSALLAVGDANRVKRSAYDVIADTGQILDAAAANEHDRVLLKVVADAGDVGGHLNPVGQAHASHIRRAEFGFLGVCV
jgi:hypothetical protein